MTRGYFFLLSFMALLMPFVSRGANDGSTINMVEELNQLRARTDALEKKLSETSPVPPI